MHRWLLVLILALACNVDDGENGADPCSVETCSFPPGAVCSGNVCVVGGIYGDCMNNSQGCGCSDVAVCLTTDPSPLLLAGYGVCSKVCESDFDCWWALPDPAFPASCTFLEAWGDSYCIIPCIDDSCPVDMVCRGGACAFDADGCGPTANPGGAECTCDPGREPCSSEDALCCDIPGVDSPDALVCSRPGGGGGGGGGGGCCRHCTDGIPCGDTCIAAGLECHRPTGCAC